MKGLSLLLLLLRLIAINRNTFKHVDCLADTDVNQRTTLCPSPAKLVHFICTSSKMTHIPKNLHYTTNVIYVFIHSFMHFQSVNLNLHHIYLLQNPEKPSKMSTLANIN